MYGLQLVLKHVIDHSNDTWIHQASVEAPREMTDGLAFSLNCQFAKPSALPGQCSATTSNNGSNGCKNSHCGPRGGQPVQRNSRDDEYAPENNAWCSQGRLSRENVPRGCAHGESILQRDCMSPVVSGAVRNLVDVLTMQVKEHSIPQFIRARGAWANSHATCCTWQKACIECDAGLFLCGLKALAWLSNAGAQPSR